MNYRKQFPVDQDTWNRPNCRANSKQVKNAIRSTRNNEIGGHADGQGKGPGLVLAGGTDLLVSMKGGFIEPDLIVDIKRIKAHARQSRNRPRASRSALPSPGAALAENAALIKAWPGVVEGANLIGSKQVQGRCTIVGNLCNASPAADSVPALVAAGAKVVISGPKGKRIIPVEQVPIGPGSTSLKKGEIVEAILLPQAAAQVGRCLSALHSAHRNGYRGGELLAST